MSGIKLRAVWQTDNTFDLVDQDGRRVENIVAVDRVWRVGELGKLRFEVLDVDCRGDIQCVPDGWVESVNP